MNRDKALFFDGQAGEPWAAEEYGDEEAPKLARLVKEAGLGPGQRVLEPGCGTGRLSEVLARAVGPAGSVLALDISPAMAEACQRRVAALPQVDVRCTGLEELDEKPGSFDAAICHQVFPHFDDQPQALRRLHSLLRPGSALLVVHFISRAEINDTHRKAGTVVEGDLLPEPAVMRLMMEEAGFSLEMLADDDLGYFLRARRI